MSSNALSNENSSSHDLPTQIATIEHSGNLIEHLACRSSAALLEQIQNCNKKGQHLIAGHPSKLPANPAKRIDFFVTLDAEKIIEHSRADQVISVEAGISIAALQDLLKQNKQWFPVYLRNPSNSLMEYINDGDSGPLEHGFGEARDLVLGMQVVLGSGELIKCGGKVVKNVTGYDLPKLFAGAKGTLCVPYSAHLRLFALPERAETNIFNFHNRQEAFAAARKLCQSGLPISCLEIFGGEIHKHSPPQISTALPQLSGEQCAMALQIHGISSVVDELVRETKEIIGGTALGITLESELEEVLWTYLARPQSDTDWTWIQLAAPNKALEQVLKDFADKGELAWTARPGRQKALLLVPNVESSALVSSAAEKLSELKQKATVAYADNQYNYKVQTLPSEDAVLGELKHRLKRELDPHAVLNPLALL